MLVLIRGAGDLATGVALRLYRAGLQGARYSFSAAVGLFNSAVNAIILITVNWLSKRVDRDYGLW